MPHRPLDCRVWFLALIVAAPTWAADTVDYGRDVKPLLQHCYSCHGGLRQQSGLRVDTAAGILRGGDSGAAIVPGKSAESLLIHALTGTNGATRMPPEGEAAPLTPEKIEKIRAWIDQGAVAPPESEPPGPRQHWAFQQPTRPALPATTDRTWPRNAIDQFVLAEQERRGLQHAPESPKNILLRRVYLDLIGIPPTPDELQAFLADESPDAYERVVMRLLESPQYGERWGRHWMDVWRYSDWAGYGAEIRESQYHIWRWRDWIVEALNADRPYDQMILEMVAGDEIAPLDSNVLRATGYLGRNWFRYNRNVWLDNTIEHSGKAFLGLTLNCARCHDHKYDPISQNEYYQLRAIFEAYDVRYDRVTGQKDVTKDGIARVFDKSPDEPTFVFIRGNDQTPDKEHPQKAAIPEFFGVSYTATPIPLPVESFYPSLTADRVAESRATLIAEAASARSGVESAGSTLANTKARLEKLASGVTNGTLPQPTVFLADNFDGDANGWTRRGGQWELRDGLLIQKEIVSSSSESVSAANHPADFRAVLRFKTIGGGTYKSVGMSFDVLDPGTYQGVYLSAYDAGPKLQIYHSQQGQAAYPAAGMIPLPVKIGDEQCLEIAVRGKLINVWVNGEFKLAYEISGERKAGKFSIWTYDASAEFLDVQVEQLLAEVELAAAGSKVAPTPYDPTKAKAVLEKAVGKAEQLVATAEKRHAAAQAKVESFDSRLAAERAKYGLSSDGDAKQLARLASSVEHRANRTQAELELLEAEQTLAEAQAAEKPGDAKSMKNVEEARLKRNTVHARLEGLKSDLPPDSEKYAALGDVYPTSSTGRRLALARWLTSRENPLTARVAINHMWLRHFGKAVVPTVFDFGLNGKPPTHPALIDWLSVELMENGWSMKHIHRLMVLSATYRQSSSVTDFETPSTHQQAVDPDNQFLWRMNPRRLEAEIVRDCLLSVAGSLDATLGGPEKDQTQGQIVPRRSIYFRHAKEKEMVFTKLFDGPGVSECYQRDESIVPQQALALANSPLAKNQSRLLAKALSQDYADQVDQFIVAAFERVLTRAPTAEELTACREFLTAQAQLFVDPSRLTPTSVGDPGTVPAAADPQQRARENLVHVLLNHHDFVTVR